MNWDPWLPLLALANSLLTGLFIFLLKEEQHLLRTMLNRCSCDVYSLAFPFPF